jgi:hypothetical protein
MTVDVRYAITGELLKLFSSSQKDEPFGQKISAILMKCQEVLYRIIHAMLFSNNMPFPVFFLTEFVSLFLLINSI